MNPPPFQLPDWLIAAQPFSLYIGAGLLAALLLSSLMMLFMGRWLRGLDIPAGAGFVDTLLIIPLSVAVCLDLMDMALDLFGAPIVWVFLGRYNLKGLRTVTTLQALLPGTQLIPILSLAWIGARLRKWLIR